MKYFNQNAADTTTTTSTSASSTNVNTAITSTSLSKWKSMFIQRYIVERNWRECRYSTRRLDGHVGQVTCIEVGGRLLVSGSMDCTVKVWQIAPSDRLLMTLTGHQSPISALQFDESKIISACREGVIKVWSLSSGACVRTVDGRRNGQHHLTCLQFHNHLLVAGYEDGAVSIWDGAMGQNVLLRAHNIQITAIQIQQVNKSKITTNDEVSIIFTSSIDGSVKQWDWRERVCLQTFHGHLGPVHSIKLCGVNRLLSCGSDGTVRVWDTQVGRAKELDRWFGHVMGANWLAYNSFRFCSAGREGCLIIHDSNGRLLNRIWPAVDVAVDVAVEVVNNQPAVTALAMDDLRIFFALEQEHAGDDNSGCSIFIADFS